MENTQWESKKQAEVRAGNKNNLNPIKIQEQSKIKNQTQKTAQKCRHTVQQDFTNSECEHKLYTDRLTG